MRIHRLRKLFSPFYVRCYILVLLSLVSATLVSTVDIVRNMPKTLYLAEHVNYFSYALSHTEFIVQILSVFVFALLLFFVRDGIAALLRFRIEGGVLIR